MYRIFYNRAHVGDVLFIVIDPLTTPDEVKRQGDVAALYKEGRLVGVNLFNFGDKCKVKAEGMIIAPPDALIDIVNHELAHEGLDPLPYARESGFRIALVKETEEHPLDERARILTLDFGDETKTTVSRYANFEAGDKIVVLVSGAMRLNGTLFEAHVVKNIPIEAEVCSESDLGIGENSTQAYLPEGDIGSDFFCK